MHRSKSKIYQVLKTIDIAIQQQITENIHGFHTISNLKMSMIGQILSKKGLFFQRNIWNFYPEMCHAISQFIIVFSCAIIRRACFSILPPLPYLYISQVSKTFQQITEYSATTAWSHLPAKRVWWSISDQSMTGNSTATILFIDAMFAHMSHRTATVVTSAIRNVINSPLSIDATGACFQHLHMLE